MHAISIGLDVGASQHSVAICNEGKVEAERGVLRISESRQGFDELDRRARRDRADRR